MFENPKQIGGKRFSGKAKTLLLQTGPGKNYKIEFSKILLKKLTTLRGSYFSIAYFNLAPLQPMSLASVSFITQWSQTGRNENSGSVKLERSLLCGRLFELNTNM